MVFPLQMPVLECITNAPSASYMSCPSRLWFLDHKYFVLGAGENAFIFVLLWITVWNAKYPGRCFECQAFLYVKTECHYEKKTGFSEEEKCMNINYFSWYNLMYKSHLIFQYNALVQTEIFILPYIHAADSSKRLRDYISSLVEFSVCSLAYLALPVPSLC